jgi:UDP-N-acetylglucosamine 2-epimerase (non-hydrolysing)
MRTKTARTAIILGTRPEIIKMSPVIRECRRRELDFLIIHTEQHHAYEMDRVFFEDLQLPEPRFRLGVGQGAHGAQTGRLLQGIEKVLVEQKPDAVLVQGDTNTVLAGALAAAKLHVPVGHVEAGLRSYDRRMPEELNRVLADHASDLLFAPTGQARDILLSEGIDDDKIHVTGNTIVDAVEQNLAIARSRGRSPTDHGLSDGGYIVVTAHRPENVDHGERLEMLLEAVANVRRETGLEVICPLHPRTENKVRTFGLQMPEEIRIIEPLGFLDFLQLEAQADLILTDSGGMQEEACILQVPCVTLRENTERPETVEAGANVLAGIQPREVLRSVRDMLGRNGGWSNPFGDGRSARRILDIVTGTAPESSP